MDHSIMRRNCAWGRLLCIVALLAMTGIAWAAMESADVPLLSPEKRTAVEAERWTDRPPSTRKAPYLIYAGVNTEMDVHWQLDSTSGCTIEWGTDTSYSLGSAVTTEYGTDHQHTHTIADLTPGTLYYYRVTVGGMRTRARSTPRCPTTPRSSSSWPTATPEPTRPTTTPSPTR